MSKTLAFLNRIQQVMASRREIMVIWCVEDVRHVRPDLTHQQSWQVLRQIRDSHDAGIGINWDVIESTAADLFGFPADKDEG